MQCSQVRLLIPAYVKNELTVLEKLEMKHHFGQCPICSSRMIALQAATQSRQSERNDQAATGSLKNTVIDPKAIVESPNEQLELTAAKGLNHQKETGAEEIMEENLKCGSGTEQPEPIQLEGKQEMTESKHEKSKFRPQKARRGEHTAEQKLTEAGILIPYPAAHLSGTNASLAAAQKREQKMPEAVLLKTEVHPVPAASSELNGEDLLRMRMLAMLAEETAKLQQQGEVNRLTRIGTVEIAAPSKQKVPETNLIADRTEDRAPAEHSNWIDEPDHSWQMLTETQSATLEEMEQKAEAILASEAIEPPEVQRWQDDPNQYVEVPYIHPVTQVSVLRKIRRSSPEGLLFLQEQAEKQEAEAAVLREEEKRRSEEREEQQRRQAEAEQAALLLQESEREVKQGSNRTINPANASAQTARSRLLSQIEKEAGNADNTVDKKPVNINKTAKLLPFSENPKRQAAFFRFLCLVLLLLSLLFAYGWWTGAAHLSAAVFLPEEAKITLGFGTENPQGRYCALSVLWAL